MSKANFSLNSLTLNIVFLLCLTGSILVAVIQVKGQHGCSSPAVTSSEPAAHQSGHGNSAG